jgi:hypothetical protein
MMELREERAMVRLLVRLSAGGPIPEGGACAIIRAIG